MVKSDLFFKVLGLNPFNKKEIQNFSEEVKISLETLAYYNESNILPSEKDLKKICSMKNLSQLEVCLGMGILNSQIIKEIAFKAKEIHKILDEKIKPEKTEKTNCIVAFETVLGKLYQDDCIKVMHTMLDDSVDLIFADPPFNLSKLYPSGIDDNLKTDLYIEWSERWISECVRILKPGGSFFLYNLPRWNTTFSDFLNKRLTFRHWITIDMKYSLPIKGRLYPSHYSLLYYCKGKRPNTFHCDRLPMDICPSCMTDLKDYGGYKDKMNPQGVNLSDVWIDIPPVRHNKYKKRKDANELSLKLLDRIIEMASNDNDLIFDPFGGSGTTFIVSEIKKRKWIGCEIGPIDDIVNRFSDIMVEKGYLQKIRKDYNRLFTEKNEQKRKEKGLWTAESFKDNVSDENSENKLKIQTSIKNEEFSF